MKKVLIPDQIVVVWRKGKGMRFPFTFQSPGQC